MKNQFSSTVLKSMPGVEIISKDKKWENLGFL